MEQRRRLSVALRHLNHVAGPHAQPGSAAASSHSVLLWPDGAPDSSDGGVFQPSLDIRLHPSAATPLGAVLIMPGGVVIFVEVKAETGRLSALQNQTISEMRSVGARVCVVWSRSDVDELMGTL